MRQEFMKRAGAMVTAVTFGLSAAGCASLQGREAGGPCDGAMIVPHSEYSLNMTRQSAGLGDQRMTYQYGRSIWGPYNASFYQGKPSEVVQVITSVNGVTWDVRIDAGTSNGWAMAGAILGAAAAAQFGAGGGQIASAIAGLGIGAIAGSRADSQFNANGSNKATACFKWVAAGENDYVVAAKKPPGDSKLVPSSRGRGWDGYGAERPISPRPFMY